MNVRGSDVEGVLVFGFVEGGTRAGVHLFLGGVSAVTFADQLGGRFF